MYNSDNREEINLDEEYYEVEEIINFRFNRKEKCLEYFIKWKGYREDQNS